MRSLLRESQLTSVILCFGFLSCKARESMSPSPSSEFKQTTGSGLGASDRLLTNLAAPINNPDRGVAQELLIDELDGGSSFTNVLSNLGSKIGKIPNTDSFKKQSWDVLNYETTLKTSQNKGTIAMAPGPMAGKSVLEVMRKNRKEFAMIVEEGKANTPNLFGFYDALSLTPAGQRKSHVIPNPKRPFVGTPCGNPTQYDPDDYSDVKWHYYCAIPGVFRACQRLIAGFYTNSYYGDLKSKYESKSLSMDDFFNRVSTLTQADEEMVRTYCLNPAKVTDANIRKKYDETMTQFEGINGLQAGDIRKYFNLFYDSQVDLDSGVNMYDYIMRSGIYSFDYEQQQAVLNTYYADMKPKVLDRASGVMISDFDPADSTDCKTYREPRFLREKSSGIAGTHCLASTAKERPFFIGPNGKR